MNSRTAEMLQEVSPPFTQTMPSIEILTPMSYSVVKRSQGRIHDAEKGSATA